MGRPKRRSRACWKWPAFLAAARFRCTTGVPASRSEARLRLCRNCSPSEPESGGGRLNAWRHLLKQCTQEEEFGAIRIGLGCPEKIRSWSYAQVKKRETINYRTFKPERDGLFC